MQFAYLKLHLSNFVQDDFFDAQDTENDLAWPFENFKHSFIDFTKGVYLDVL
jgi:hypothetical protein